MTKQNKPMTVYLAHGISDKANFHDSLRIAEEIENIKTTNGLQKFKVYAPAGNKKINDKSNNPTPIDIYDEDMKRLDSHDVVVANYTGVNSIGTLLEISTLGAYYQKVRQIITDANKLEVELTKDLFTSQKYMDDEYESAYEQGYNKGIEDFVIKFINQQMLKLPKVYVYTSNARTIQPQLYNPRLQEQYDPEKHGKNLFGFIASGSENHMVVGMIVRHLEWCETEEEVMEKLKEL